MHDSCAGSLAGGGWGGTRGGKRYIFRSSVTLFARLLVVLRRLVD